MFLIVWVYTTHWKKLLSLVVWILMSTKLHGDENTQHHNPHLQHFLQVDYSKNCKRYTSPLPLVYPLGGTGLKVDTDYLSTHISWNSSTSEKTPTTVSCAFWSMESVWSGWFFLARSINLSVWDCVIQDLQQSICFSTPLIISYTEIFWRISFKYLPYQQSGWMFFPNSTA